MLGQNEKNNIMPVKGIDVSFYEPVIDWLKVQQAGYQFTFVRCSQANYNDTRFSTHWKNAKDAGIPRGAYHLYDPSVAPEIQAERFFYSLNGDFGELPFVVDIELFTSGPYYGSQNWYNYIEKLNSLSNNFPLMIYTAYYYWKDNVYKSPAVQDIGYFGKYPLWVAGYDTITPLVPEPWHPNYLFWQYSESGIVDGVTDQLGRPTKCDLDYFNGNDEQFQLLLDSIPPSGGSMTSIFYRANGNATIRTGPSSSYPQVPASSGEQYVLTNDIVETMVPLQNGWINIANIYRNDVRMRINNPAWSTAAYMVPVTYNPPSGTTPPPQPGTDDFKLYRNGVLVYHIIGTEQT